jgi:hypothetical protein
MEEKLKQQVLDAFLLVMRPIVRILLRYGIGYREFVEVTKTVYVDIASSDFGLRGRPTNISRVAVMTGLTRKEAKRLRDKIASGDSRIMVKTTPLADVLHHWHSEAEFTDANGAPLRLSFSDGRGSFTELVKRFGGDVPAGAMRTEMKRVGSVEEDESGNLTVTSRAFEPASNHQKLQTLLAHGAYPMLCNIEHNTKDMEGAEGTWANRIAFTQAVPRENAGQLRRITRDRIIDFAESVDDLFMAYESIHESGSVKKDREPIAVGIFYFEEIDENANYDW